MKCIEITENHSSALTKPIKPLSPQQARLDALKRQKDNVNKALDAERKRQKVVKAQQSLQNALVEELPTWRISRLFLKLSESELGGE